MSDACQPYLVVLSRGCADLYPTVSSLLASRSSVAVIVDRRHAFSDHTVARPPSSGPGVKVPTPPRLVHVVIRRDCAHLYEDLTPAFADREDTRVVVDRRGRSRAPSRPNLPSQAEQRRADPPVWIV